VVIQNASTRKSIIDRLRVLANHNNSKIRYATLISLGGLIEEEDDSTAREFYFKMSKDKDKAISSIAKKWLSKF
jgi:hypothetical protein